MGNSIQKELSVTRTIPPEYIKRCCQNAQYAEVFSYTTLEDEVRPRSCEDGGLDLVDAASDEDSLVQWYLALRAADAFREERGQWAGDLAALVQVAAKVVESYKVEEVTAEHK